MRRRPIVDDEDGPFLTVEQVADAFRVSRWAVSRWIGKGALEAIKVGDPTKNGSVRIPLRSYREFVRRHTVTPHPEEGS